MDGTTADGWYGALVRALLRSYIYEFYVMWAPEMDKMLSLMCLQCWRLYEMASPVSSHVSANSFSYGFLYTQFPVPHPHDCRHVYRNDSNAATFRLLLVQHPTSKKPLSIWLHRRVHTENLVFLLGLCLCTLCSAVVPRIAGSCQKRYTSRSVHRYIGRLCSMVYGNCEWSAVWRGGGGDGT